MSLALCLITEAQLDGLREISAKLREKLKSVGMLAGAVGHPLTQENKFWWTMVFNIILRGTHPHANTIKDDIIAFRASKTRVILDVQKYLPDMPGVYWCGVCVKDEAIVVTRSSTIGNVRCGRCCLYNLEDALVVRRHRLVKNLLFDLTPRFSAYHTPATLRCTMQFSADVPASSFIEGADCGDEWITSRGALELEIKSKQVAEMLVDPAGMANAVMGRIYHEQLRITTSEWSWARWHYSVLVKAGGGLMYVMVFRCAGYLVIKLGLTTRDVKERWGDIRKALHGGEFLYGIEVRDVKMAGAQISPQFQGVLGGDVPLDRHSVLLQYESDLIKECKEGSCPLVFHGKSEVVWCAEKAWDTGLAGKEREEKFHKAAIGCKRKMDEIKVALSHRFHMGSDHVVVVKGVDAAFVDILENSR